MKPTNTNSIHIEPDDKRLRSIACTNEWIDGLPIVPKFPFLCLFRHRWSVVRPEWTSRLDLRIRTFWHCQRCHALRVSKEHTYEGNNDIVLMDGIPFRIVESNVNGFLLRSIHPSRDPSYADPFHTVRIKPHQLPDPDPRCDKLAPPRTILKP